MKARYTVIVSDGDTPLIDKDFRTSKAAAEYVAGLISSSSTKRGAARSRSRDAHRHAQQPLTPLNCL